MKPHWLCPASGQALELPPPSQASSAKCRSQTTVWKNPARSAWQRQRNINQIIWPCSQPSLPFFTFCFPYEVARINATTFSTFLNISQHTSRIFFLVFPCLGSFAVWSISRSFRLDPVKVARVLCSGSCRRLFRISLVVHAVHAPSKTIT
jgi:hypothetical protein